MRGHADGQVVAAARLLDKSSSAIVLLRPTSEETIYRYHPVGLLPSSTLESALESVPQTALIQRMKDKSGSPVDL